MKLAAQEQLGKTMDRKEAWAQGNFRLMTKGPPMQRDVLTINVLLSTINIMEQH